VEWKDIVYDDTHGLRLRMYRPTTTGGDGEKNKLPVLVYFHGGGFCLASFEVINFHAGALRLAAELPALVLSADYRLAPEHRLPAALDDAESAFSWLRAQAAASPAADPWLAESADFGRVFVSGDSAGGNISHHVSVRHGSGRLPLGPLRLAGCVMLWPYFGGEAPTPSEAASPPGEPMGTALFDQMWRLALPPGASKDHPAANPFAPERPARRPRRRLPAGARAGPRPGRAARPRGGLRREAEGRRQGRRARRVPWAGACVLRQGAVR
jgi:acetyl esterase/lipase